MKTTQLLVLTTLSDSPTTSIESEIMLWNMLNMNDTRKARELTI